jgi:hypothetical protein
MFILRRGVEIFEKENINYSKTIPIGLRGFDKDFPDVVN